MEYNFGEKKKEFINGNSLPVTFKTPKYEEAKKKAIELLENPKYKEILLPSDFWILVNTYKNKTEAMYSGLIISHDGCLKINDTLDTQFKFKPECVSIEKDGYNNSLVYTYICKEQGLYEVGEVSDKNCKQDYPYAMALKRCFDRVVLKNSKIAYSGIYSDSEAEEFTKRVDDTQIEESKKATKTTKVTKTKTTKKDVKGKVNSETGEIILDSKTNYVTALISELKKKGINVAEYAKKHDLGAQTTQEEAYLLLQGLEEELNGNQS